MSFIHFNFLIALSALSVPILLHILNRRFNKRRQWAAMIFLKDSFSSRRRRIVLEDSLVLVVRTLLITFLVLGLARPIITHSSGIPWGIVFVTFFVGMITFSTSFAIWQHKKLRKALTVISIILLSVSVGLVTVEKFRAISRFLKLNPQDVVVIIDGSASMSRIYDGKTLFQKAVADVEQVIKTSSSGTSFSIIIAGSEPIVRNKIPISDRNALLSIMSQLSPPLGTFNITDALKAALSSLAHGNHYGKTVLIFSDGQKNGWKSDVPSIWQHFQRSITNFPSKPRFIFKKITGNKVSRNLGISSISFSKNSIGINQETEITVTVENTGDEAVTAEELKLIIGDKEYSNKAIGQLRPGASKSVVFTHNFSKIGTEIITARLIINDDISWDNQRYAVKHIIDKLNILIVDSSLSTNPRKSSSFFTRLALNPVDNFTKSNSTNKFLFNPTVINATEIVNYNDFYDFDAVILCDVPRLPSFTAEKIVEFVKHGGGLLIAPGSKCIPEFYNSWRMDDNKFLPAELLRRVSANNDDAVSPETKSMTHPIFNRLSKSMKGTIESIEVKNHWVLDYEEFDASIKVGGLLSDNTPLLLDRSVNNGHVLLLPFMLDSNDSNLVITKCFVPIIHETLYYLTKNKQLDFNFPVTPRSTIVINQNVAASISSSKKGLKTDFFRDPFFKDKLTSSTEKQININTDITPALQHYSGKFISVRWEGTIIPEETGLYTIAAEATGEINVWLNNKFILQTNEKKNGFDYGATQLPLNKDGNYNLRVEYIGRGDFHAKLAWDCGDGMVTIPERVFGRNDSLQRQNRCVAVMKTDKGVDNKIHILNKRGKLTARFNSSQPGLYKLYIPKHLLKHCSKVVDSKNTIPINVLLDLNESKLELLTPKELKIISQYIDIIPVKSLDDIETILMGGDTGVEFWKYFILAALSLLLIELLLTHWIAIQRKSGEDLDINFEDSNKPSKSFLAQLSLIKSLSRGK